MSKISGDWVGKRMKVKWTLGLFLFLFGIQVGQAQIQVEFTPDRKMFITHEPVSGVLTLVNRAGRDLVMGGKNGGSWLDFSITDGKGRMVTPMPGAPFPKPIVLPNGETFQKRIVINKYYPMGTSGVYRVKAMISFPQIARVFQTKMFSVQVADGQAMWSQVFGVPQGRPDAGSYREYALLAHHHGAREKSLYFRLSDSTNGIVKRTYALGDYLAVRPPTHAIDRSNILHVLHMSGPKAFAYTRIDVDGRPLEQETYIERGSSRPELVSDGNGAYAVVGGITYEESLVSYENREFKALSERPPGLPVIPMRR